jgi:hypothetical protein
MNKFRENNPLFFYAGILIIGVLIYSKITADQKQVDEKISQRIFESKPIEENQKTIEPKAEKELKIGEEKVVVQNNPERDRVFRLMSERGRRRFDMGPHSILKKSYIYKDDAPYGRIVTVTYDNFFEKYHIIFFNEQGDEVHFQLLQSNFDYEDDMKSLWSFKYKGSIYRLEDDISRF